MTIFACLALFGQTNTIDPLKVLSGHKYKINCLCYSNDGKYLASGSWDNTVMVWDMGTYTLLYELKGHSDWIRGISISPGNKYIVSTSHDGTFILWDLASGNLIKQVRISEGKIMKKGIIPELSRETINSVSSVAFSTDGELLATGSVDNLIRIWDVKTFKLLHTLEGHNHSVFSIIFSNNLMISGAIYSELIIWDLKDFKPIKTLKETKCYNGSLHIIHNGELLANTGNCHINIWDIYSGEIVRKIPVQCQLQGLQFTPEEKYMITCAEDHTVKIWDFENGEEVWSYYNPKPEIADCKLSPDGMYLAVATPESNILIWETVRLLGN